MFQYLFMLILAAGSLASASLDEKIQAYILEHPEVIVKALELHEKQLKEQKLLQITQQEPYDIVLQEGKGNAQILLYYDYRCGACKRSHLQVEKFTAKHPEITTILRPLPILGGDSVKAALMAYDAARAGKQHELHKELINSSGLLPLVKLSQSLRLTLVDQFEDHWAFKYLENNYRQSLSLDNKSVPLFVLSVGNKHQVLNGLEFDNSLELTYSELRNAAN